MKDRDAVAPLSCLAALLQSGWAFLLVFAVAPHLVLAEPTPAASASFNAYAAAVEARLAQQHRRPDTFLSVGRDESGPDAWGPDARARPGAGQAIIERMPDNAEIPGAMLHHWRGSAFVPGATVTSFECMMQDFAAYPQHFSPQVLQARVLSQNNVGQPDSRFQVTMRVRQQHVLTVVLDTTYDVTFNRLDARHGSSTSRSTRVAEIDAPGTPQEHALDSAHEHGFLWRQNTYWSYEQRDGGLYVQVESLSLTRSIPRGLGWAVQPFVESVPRDSLQFTLASVCAALRPPTPRRPL